MSERFLIGFHTEKIAANCSKCGKVATDSYVDCPSAPPSLHVYTPEGKILCRGCEPTPADKSVGMELLQMYRRMLPNNERSRVSLGQGDRARASDLSMRQAEERQREAAKQREEEERELARAKEEVINEMARERLKQNKQNKAKQ